MFVFAFGATCWFHCFLKQCSKFEILEFGVPDRRSVASQMFFGGHVPFEVSTPIESRGIDESHEVRWGYTLPWGLGSVHTPVRSSHWRVCTPQWGPPIGECALPSAASQQGSVHSAPPRIHGLGKFMPQAEILTRGICAVSEEERNSWGIYLFFVFVYLLNFQTNPKS
jgi:hypothetical protein